MLSRSGKLFWYVALGRGYWEQDFLTISPGVEFDPQPTRVLDGPLRRYRWNSIPCNRKANSLDSVPTMTVSLSLPVFSPGLHTLHDFEHRIVIIIVGY